MINLCSRLVARYCSLSIRVLLVIIVLVGIPTDVVLSQADRILWSNLALFMSCLLLSLLTAWLIGKRSIADRIELLGKASQRIARGNLDARISTLVGGGELGVLGESFDSIAKRARPGGASEDRQREELPGNFQRKPRRHPAS